MTSTTDHIQPHRLTVAQYHRMAEAGVFHEDDRIELIEGSIVDRTPIGSRHAAIVTRLERILGRALGEQVIVWGQNPVVLGDMSEPEPDIALLKPREDDYASAHPRAKDILAIIEVADKSPHYARDVKVPLYARHGIPEVWLVDLTEKRLHLFRDPGERGYVNESVCTDLARINLLSFPSSPIDLSGLFRFV